MSQFEPVVIMAHARAVFEWVAVADQLAGGPANAVEAIVTPGVAAKPYALPSPEK